MGEFFIKQLQELEETSLQKDVQNLLGETFSEQEGRKQSVTNSKVDRSEVTFLRPENPLVKPGTLLGLDTKMAEGQLDAWGMCKAANDSDKELFLKPLRVKAVEEITETRVVLERPLMVTGDCIEVYKNTCFYENSNADQRNESVSTYYRVTHYIEVLDENSKYFIATNLFSDSEHTHDRNNKALVIDDSYDLSQIEHIYANANVDKVLAPLVPLTK